MSFNILKDVLHSGIWGTIGPHSLSGGKALAEYSGTEHALLVHSAAAAYESVLRSLQTAHGDRIVMASYGNPSDSLVAAAAGAAPVFIDIDYETAVPSPGDIDGALANNTGVRAAVIDLPGGILPDIASIADICGRHGIPLIINAGTALKVFYNGKPLTRFAHAVICDLTPYAGSGGAVLTDSSDAYNGAAAYHNCGRPMGAGSTLNFDDIIGGDMRITEWTACLVAPALAEAEADSPRRRAAAEGAAAKYACDYLIPVRGSADACDAVIFRYESAKNSGIPAAEYAAREGIFSPGYKAMHRQNIFRSDYFRRMTGSDGIYDDGLYANSIKAEENYLWLKI